MNKKIIIIIGVIILGLSAWLIFLFIKAEILTRKLIQKEQVLEGLRKQTDVFKEEREKIVKEKDKIEADTVAYLQLNLGLQKEKERLEGSIAQAQTALKAKEDALTKARSELKGLNQRIIKERVKAGDALMKECGKMQEKTKELEGALQSERILYHYNLAVAYTQAELYDEAVAEYEKSLQLKEDNPDACYNLGLIYDQVKDDAPKAAGYYRKYLKLRPEAEEKKEIEERLEILE